MTSCNLDVTKVREQSLCGEQNMFPLDASPIRGAISTLPPIDLQVVSQPRLEPRWNDLVLSHHYLSINVF